MVKRNIIISNAGGNSSGKNYKISLPARMVKALGVTEDDRGVFVFMNYNPMGTPTIVITKRRI